MTSRCVPVLAPVAPVAVPLRKPSTYTAIAPVLLTRVATKWCHCPSLIVCADWTVVTTPPILFCTPKANLPLSCEAPKSLVRFEFAVPSIRPLPSNHLLPLAEACVVLTQNEREKSVNPPD